MYLLITIFFSSVILVCPIFRNKVLSIILIEYLIVIKSGWRDLWVSRPIIVVSVISTSFVISKTGVLNLLCIIMIFLIFLILIGSTMCSMVLRGLFTSSSTSSTCSMHDCMFRFDMMFVVLVYLVFFF